MTQVDVKTVTKKKKVGYDTVYKNTDDLDKGKTKVETEGKNGERTIVYTEVRHDGKLQSREDLRRSPARPRDKVVLRGTKEDEVERLRRLSTGGNSRLGPARPVRVRRQLVDQHRQRLLRRPPVQRLDLAGHRRQRHAAPGQPRDTDRHRREGAGRRGLGPVAWPACSARKLGLR